MNDFINLEQNSTTQDIEFRKFILNCTHRRSGTKRVLRSRRQSFKIRCHYLTLSATAPLGKFDRTDCANTTGSGVLVHNQKYGNCYSFGTFTHVVGPKSHTNSNLFQIPGSHPNIEFEWI
jgi:hypothetical protein